MISVTVTAALMFMMILDLVFSQRQDEYIRAICWRECLS